MKVITEAVDRVKDPFWKKTSEQSLDEIRQQAPAACPVIGQPAIGSERTSIEVALWPAHISDRLGVR